MSQAKRWTKPVGEKQEKKIKKEAIQTTSLEDYDGFDQVSITDWSELKTKIDAATKDTVFMLDASLPLTLTSEVLLTGLSTNHTIVVYGGDLSGPVLPSASKKHIRVSNTGSGKIIFDSLNLKGLRTAAEISGGTAGTSGGQIDFGAGVYLVKDSRFEAIAENAMAVGGSADVTVERSTFKDHMKYDNGGAIASSGKLQVHNCTFDNNINYGAGYSVGGILVNGPKNVIKNSAFLNNQAFWRGGAIGTHQGAANAEILIDQCYFEGNSTSSVNSSPGSHDGGAISIFNGGVNVDFKLTNSTFYNNYSYDDAGAVFIEKPQAGCTNYIANCTIIGNHADNKHLTTGSSGGAIQISLTTACTLENNTITMNYLPGSAATAGAGLGMHQNSSNSSDRPTVSLKNNIIMGNYARTASTGAKNYGSSVNVSSSYGTAINENNSNIGFDKGTKVDPNIMPEIFGTDNPSPAENGSGIQAGNPNESATASYYRYIPTVTIIPGDGTDAPGLADNVIAPRSLPKDQRDFDRDLNKSDAGSLEILWAKFDANGGEWKGLDDLVYDGSDYYKKDDEGSAPNYYKITQKGGVIAAPANPTREDFVFDGWYTDSGLTEKWAAATDAKVNEDRTIYAKWKPRKVDYTVTYVAGSNGTIVLPDSEIVEEDASPMAIPGTTPNAGYGFVGWTLDKAVYASSDITVDGSTITAGTAIPASTQLSEDDLKLIIVKEDLTATAHFKALQYTLSFDTDGGQPAMIANIQPTFDSVIKSAPDFPGDPTKLGHTFEGWKYKNITPGAGKLGTQAVEVDDMLSPADKMPGKNVALIAVWKPKAADLSVKKSLVSDPSGVVHGAKLKYRIVVENKGEGYAHNVVATDKPSGLDFTSWEQQPGVTFNQDKMQWTIASIAPGKKVTINYTMTVKQTAALVSNAVLLESEDVTGKEEDKTPELPIVTPTTTQTPPPAQTSTPPGGGPATGDDSNLGLWIALAGLGAVAASAVALKRRKSN